MLEWSRGLPIYVVTLARPDLIERRPDWGAGKRNFVSMYLEPLSEADMRELLAGLVPGLPEQAVATIVARADGIPLYAVETVRTLVAEGRLVQRDGVFAPVGDLASLSVPETLSALIASRLDTLEETDRRLIHDAAVLGQSFTAASLSAISGIAEAELEPRLAGLVRRELLQRQMDPRSPERGHYEFVQALIREVAYNTLSRKDRKRLHLAAARYFESQGNEEIAGVLASHYLAAQANAAEGDEAHALAGQARLALKAAATRASALGSFDQAVTFLEQALTVTSDAREESELLRDAGHNARFAGRHGDAERHLRRAVDVARAAGDVEQIVLATTELAAELDIGFRADEARALVAGALEEFADADEVLIAGLKLNFAHEHYARTDLRRGLEILDDVLGVAERRGISRMIARGLLVRGGLLWSLGRRREAYAVASAARDLAAEHGLTDLLLQAAGNLANAQTEVDAAEAVRSWHEGLALARKLGQRGLLIHGVGNFGYAAFLAGKWDEGLAEMEIFLADDLAARDRLVMLNNALIIRAGRGEPIDEGLAEMAELGRDMSTGWELFVADPRANAALAAADLKTARDSFVAIADFDPGQQAEYLYRAARPALWAADVADARELTIRYEEAGGYGPVAEARRATLAAGIAAVEGRTNEALSLYRVALGGWRATHSVWDEALTGLDMALVLAPAGPEVAAAADSSRQTFERLGARPYLEMLDAAVKPPALAGVPGRRAATRVPSG
jgi:hypothetical protein